MPSSLSPDPITYVHPRGQSINNVFYSDKHVDHRMNLYFNSTRVSGGNPLIIDVHGGSWSANDKTGYVIITSSASVAFYHFAYFLNSAAYMTTACFDYCTLEYSAHAHEGIQKSYEPWISGPLFDVTAPSYPTYGKAIDDVQRAVQFCSDRADYYGWNRNKFVLAGDSVGGNTAINAALTPSRPWNSRARGEHQARRPSYVRGVLNRRAEVDLDPWRMSPRHAMFLLGKVQADPLQVRADVEREMLEPDATGAYPQFQPKTQRGKGNSPIDVIAEFASTRRDLKIRSHYLRNFGAVGSPPPPYGISEETVTPSTAYGYSSIPPYDAGGHDYRQFDVIAAACASVGITHTGHVINGVDFPIITSPGPLYAPDLQKGWESSLQGTYEDFVSWID